MKEILIKLRQENRYSQSLLAKILGISRQAYIKYELGEVEPSVEIVRKLSKIYNVSYDVLIDNTIIPSTKKIEYTIPKESTLEVASPTTVYSHSYNNSDTDNTIEYFKDSTHIESCLSFAPRLHTWQQLQCFDNIYLATDRRYAFYELYRHFDS